MNITPIHQLKLFNSRATNSQLQTNPNFGMKEKIANEGAKVLLMLPAAAVLAIQNGKVKEEEPVSCVINMNNIQTRQERINDENLKKTFNRILTEIESRPEIIELIKRDDSAYLPDELNSQIKYTRLIELNNGETVTYTLTKFNGGFFYSEVDLMPYSNNGSIYDNLVDNFSISYNSNGKSAGGWSYRATKLNGITTNMSYNAVGNDNITSDAYESPAFKNITKK